MFFSEIEIDIEIDLANYVENTTPYTCDFQMEKVIWTLEEKKKMLKSYFSGSITTFSRPTMKSVTF